MSLGRKLKKLVNDPMGPVTEATRKADIKFRNLTASKERDAGRLISETKDATNGLINTATKSALIISKDIKLQGNDVVDSTLAKILAVLTIGIVAYATYFFYKQKHISNADPLELITYIWSGSTIIVLVTGIITFTSKKSPALQHYFKWITSMVVCLAILAVTMYVMKNFVI